MQTQSHVLIDSNQSLVHDGAIFRGARDSADVPRWHVQLRTCRGGRSEGVHIVELDNGRITIDIIPTRGMGIWRVRRGSQTLGWQSPAGEPVHPFYVPLSEPSGLGWLDGFSELMCRCGLQSNGPPEFDASGRLLYPLHGRVANLPARRVELIVDESAGKLTVRGLVEESRFHFQSLRLTTSLSTTLGSSEFTWVDEVTNFGGREATLQMLYHFNIGQPLLRSGARITAPVALVAPLTDVAARAGVDQWHIFPPPLPESAEQVFGLELFGDDEGKARVLVSDLANDEAVGLRFSKRSLPYLTVWRNTPAEADGYVLGIEPGTNFPNRHSFEKQHGRVITLAPGESWRSEVAVAWHSEAAAIAEELDAINAIQGKRQASMLQVPREEWSDRG